MVVIVVGVVYATANKCVHLISVVPQQVMRWLGQAMGVDTGGLDVERQSHAYVGGVVNRQMPRGAGKQQPIELGDGSIEKLTNGIAQKLKGEGPSGSSPGGDAKKITEEAVS